MPLYEFACKNCDNTIEIIMTVAEMEKWSKNGFQCQKCKKGTMQKQLCAGTFIDRAKLRISSKANPYSQSEIK